MSQEKLNYPYTTEYKEVECQTKQDNINHPPHYKHHPEGIECIQITRHLSFNLGNAIKYIWRSPYKGQNVEDLRKAIWYLNDEINRLEQQGKEIK